LIQIQLNGETREVPEGLTLAALLEWLKLPAGRVAVERNLEIIARSQWGKTIIEATDRLEVVHFVGGGASDFPALLAGERYVGTFPSAAPLPVRKRGFRLVLEISQ
jgi:sulfur carrier protein